MSLPKSKWLRVIVTLIAIVALVSVVSGCIDEQPTSDEQQRTQQEQILKEGTSQVGMPAIKNFRERKLMKLIYELRDRTDLVLYAYTFSEQTGKKIFLGKCIGYPIPYSTQMTNPQKIEDSFSGGYAILPQADPNGLFSPDSADATWVLLQNPDNPSDIRPVYVEPKVIVSPFPLKD